MYFFNPNHCTNLSNFVFFFLIIFTQNFVQTYTSPLQNNELKTSLLPEAKFGVEYSDNEYTDNDEGGKGPQSPQWSHLPGGEIPLVQSTFAPILAPGELNTNITWDDQWPSEKIKFGQLSAVSIDPNGNVVVFHRGARVWGTGTFDSNEKFDREDGPIRESTIIMMNSAGKKIGEWGRSLFYLPHGLTIDSLGNYWITDVAMHQVFKFDAKDVEAELKNTKNNPNAPSAIRPSLALGDPFEPGNDKNRFCKPTGVAVQSNGDFFVSDGYCNSRIIKFNQNGERILTWGRKWVPQEDLSGRPRSKNAFFVPHALALAENLGYIFVADRENGRILCFHTNNGTFYKEYKHSVIGSRIFSIAYGREKIYAVNGPEFVSNGAHVRGFIIDIISGAVQSQFAPGKDMKNPHDIAVSKDGRAIYVVELDPHTIHKFSQEINSTLPVILNRDKGTESVSATGAHPSLQSLSSHEQSSLRDGSSLNLKNKDGLRIASGTTATTIILSLVTMAVVLVAFCVAVAAIVARCRKRGRVYTNVDDNYDDEEEEANTDFRKLIH